MHIGFAGFELTSVAQLEMAKSPFANLLIESNVKLISTCPYLHDLPTGVSFMKLLLPTSLPPQTHF